MLWYAVPIPVSKSGYMQFQSKGVLAIPSKQFIYLAQLNEYKIVIIKRKIKRSLAKPRRRYDKIKIDLQ
jgi:hypothetical protein